MRHLGIIARVGLLLLLPFIMVTATAVAELVTGPTVILPGAPLLITSYRTNNFGTDLDFLEIYNSGDTPVSLDDWAIVDTTNSRQLVLSSDHQGMLEPNHHVVLSRDGVVKGATYRLEGWQQDTMTPAVMTNLELLHESYRPALMTLSTKYIDTWMTRTYNTSSYSTTTFEQKYRDLFDDGLYIAPNDIAGLRVVEVYPYASECAPNDESILCGDYIKLENASAQTISLDELVLRTDNSSSSRTSSNTIQLSGALGPGEYRTVWQTDTGQRLSLTNSGGYIWLEDLWNTTSYNDTMTQYDAAGTGEQGLSYALTDQGIWMWTSTPAPESANSITVPNKELAPCPEGQYRNPETGRCRNIEEAITELTACDEGYERNTLTNRCRKIVSASTALAVCGEGQERNPATNRCRSIASAVAELLPCDEGYERNPATNRCRKIQDTSMPEAAFPVEPYGDSQMNSAVWWGIGGLVILALGYGIWEWRQELRGLARRLLTGVTRDR